MSRGQYIDPGAARITIRQYAESWLETRTSSPTTRTELGRRLRLHAYPVIGPRSIGTFRPEHIRHLLSVLETKPGISSSYARSIYADVRAVLSAAVDDTLLVRTPCSAKSVRAPRADASRVVPWTPDQVRGVRAALEERYRAVVDVAAGCGLRQGEVFGLAEGALDFESRTLHVVRQIKHVEGKPVFALPKGEKERDVPLPDSVAYAMKAHMDLCKPVEVSLPWGSPEGPKVTARLLFTPEAEEGKRYVSAREHGMHALRHFYASVLLDSGESVKAVSEYMGHADPAMTLRVYAHLMPNGRERSRRAVDRVLGPPDVEDHGP